MVIELLRISCPANKREAFIRRDAEVWTRGLMRHPGFVSKETWTDPGDPCQVIFVIRWQSLEQCKSFPAEWCAELDRQMGDLLMPFTCETYEVSTSDTRSFNQP